MSAGWSATTTNARTTAARNRIPAGTVPGGEKEENVWVMTEDGFFSAVEDRVDDTRVFVRSRSKVDLESLLLAITADPDVVPIASPGADYEWRVRLSKEDWAKYVAGAAEDVDYDNFKSRIGVVNPARARTYGSVWGVLLSMADERESGARSNWGRSAAEEEWNYALDIP